MKANNLTICIDATCSRKCPYCISNMTFFPKPNETRFHQNIHKAVKIAELASVSSVLISSKGEPMTQIQSVEYVCRFFNKFPLELQTNGTVLNNSIIDKLDRWGVNTIAISIDSHARMFELKEIFDKCNKKGLNVRITIVLSDLWKMEDGFNFLADCNQLGIKQVTIRKLTTPVNFLANEESMKTIEWIKTNGRNAHSTFLNQLQSYETANNLVRKLPFGPSVYNMEGVSVTTIPYCIQESNNSEDIRSLIYHQDGHMYTSWDKPSSMLF